MTSRISAVRQAGKPTLLSIGKAPPKLQHASGSSLPPEEPGHKRKTKDLAIPAGLIAAAPYPLWLLDIVELAGHNLEARGREEVNRLLHEGWHLLHIYTLKYCDDGVWRERPMAILGRSRAPDEKDVSAEAGPAAGKSSGPSLGATEQSAANSHAPHTSDSGRGAGPRLHRRSGLYEELKE